MAYAISYILIFREAQLVGRYQHQSTVRKVPRVNDPTPEELQALVGMPHGGFPEAMEWYAQVSDEYLLGGGDTPTTFTLRFDPYGRPIRGRPISINLWVPPGYES